MNPELEKRIVEVFQKEFSSTSIALHEIGNILCIIKRNSPEVIIAHGVIDTSNHINPIYLFRTRQLGEIKSGYITLEKYGFFRFSEK